MLLQTNHRREIPSSGIIAVMENLMPNPDGRPRMYPDVTLLCGGCGENFTIKGSYARMYEKKYGKSKPYCSQKCHHTAKGFDSYVPDQEAPTYACEGCGQETKRRREMVGGERKGRWDIDQRFCSRTCAHAARFAAKEAKRAEGIYPTGFINSDGYRIIKLGHGVAEKEHRLVMKRVIGRALRRNENVHHKNGNRADNSPENLELWVKTQPCGQRVEDKVAAAIQLLLDYPEFAKRAGYSLLEHRDKEIGG
jgi:hypothetical protein